MTQKVVVIMNFIKAFFQSESAGGISLLSAAILGVLVANSPIAKTVFCSHANTPWSNDYTGVGK